MRGAGPGGGVPRYGFSRPSPRADRGHRLGSPNAPKGRGVQARMRSSRPRWFLLVTIWLSSAGLRADSLELRAATNRIGRFEVLEFRLAGLGAVDDPFDPAVVEARLVVRAEGREWSVPAYFGQDYERGRHGGRDWFHPRGDAGWKARFAPLVAGDHEATAIVRDRLGERASGTVHFEARESGRPGFVRVSRKDPRWLEFSDGRPFFPIGQNLAFIGSQQYVTLTRAEEIFGRLAANGANYLRVWTGCEDWALALEAPKSAWSRSWSQRTPVVAMPDQPGRRCVLLTNEVIEVQPSHDVGLKPATAYVASGRVRVEPDTQVRLEIQGTTGPVIGPSASGETWTPFRQAFTTRPSDYWLSGMRFRREGTGKVWVTDVSLRPAEGGPELLWEADVNRPVRGWYNPLDCFWLDELLAAAQSNHLHLQLCLLTRDLYMGALKDPAGAPYDAAIADARKAVRYAVARWGAFTSVAAWEYWNELDPGLPTDRFYTELGRFLDRIDPWHHLRTTSTWGPSAKDCRHPELDLAEVHFYLRPADRDRLSDEVEAVLDRARWLREHAPGKPAHQGEAGLADDQWRILEEMKRSPVVADFHNLLWASALSGTTGTALAWWWERLDQRQVYPDYQPLSRFLADVPWTTANPQPFVAEAAGAQVRVVGLRTRAAVWLWCFHRTAAWKHVVAAGFQPGPVASATVTLDGIEFTEGRVDWWDTRSGSVTRTSGVSVHNGRVVLPVPEFTHDVAAQLRFGNAPP